jgi:hypothetical protein
METGDSTELRNGSDEQEILSILCLLNSAFVFQFDVEDHETVLHFLWKLMINVTNCT